MASRSGDLSYYGRVYVFLGRKHGGNKSSFSPTPDIVIATYRSWTNLGTPPPPPPRRFVLLHSFFAIKE
jgi:hypothetical protein